MVDIDDRYLNCLCYVIEWYVIEWFYKVTIGKIEKLHPHATHAVDDHQHEHGHVDVEVTHGTKGHVQGILEHSCPKGGFGLLVCFLTWEFRICVY